MTEDPITVVKHVFNESTYGTQRFVVLNRMPKFFYEKIRHGRDLLLVAEDSGFYDCYRFEKPTKRFSAFAGREFDIPMKDGSVTHAKGQWWSCLHPVHKEKPVVAHGYATMEKLKEFFIFYGGVCFLESLLDTCKEEPVDYHELERSLREEG